MSENNELNNGNITENTDAGLNEGNEGKENLENGNENIDANNGNNAGLGDEGGSQEDAPDGRYGCPEAYDYKDVKLPEGSQLDKEMLKEFDALNKETNLSQAQANKYMELGIKLAQKNAGNLPNLLQQVTQAKITQYQQALNTDKEICGGDKNKLNAYLDIADKGYTALASDGLKKVLAETGLNYHPEVIKLFHKLGERVGDDKVFNAKVPAGSQQDAADILYGSNNQ